MNILMIPILLFSTLINEIQISHDRKISAHIINENTKIDMNYLAFSIDDFVILKSIVESNDGECKSIIVDAIEVCKNQVESCHVTCNRIPDYQKRLIASLKVENKIQKLDVKSLEKQNKILRYAAIIAGASFASATGLFLYYR